MQKERQKYLLRWLKERQTHTSKLIKLNVIFASISALALIGQTYALAKILTTLILEQVSPQSLGVEFLVLLSGFIIRAILIYAREQVGFQCGKLIRHHLRLEILNKINELGAEAIKQKSAGHWATLLLEQVESLHNFYARFLPQQRLAMIVPVVILIAVFPVNWIAGLILLTTAPLVPIFMVLAGYAAADASQRNMDTLAKLSGQFLDRLRGLETIRLFNQIDSQTKQIAISTENFRQSTMDVLKKAFLSSAILEFFTAISIAIMAVYFGFSYLGQIHFTTGVSLFAGFFCLTLAPEFYQPLRDLGSYYHDRASAIGSADELVNFLETTSYHQPLPNSEKKFPHEEALEIRAENLIIFAPNGTALTSPLNFYLPPNSLTAIVGHSGAGKTSLLNALLGFLPYAGSLQINGCELKDLNLTQYHQNLAWVGQNPILLQGSIRENLLLGCSKATTEGEIWQALHLANADEFVSQIGLDKILQEFGGGVSVGQAQRIAIARALLKNNGKRSLLLLDEPTASLDANTEQQILSTLNQMQHSQTTIMITHRIEDLHHCDQILVMKAGKGGGEIVQVGNFAELKATGYFAQLLRARTEDLQ